MSFANLSEVIHLLAPLVAHWHSRAVNGVIPSGVKYAAAAITEQRFGQEALSTPMVNVAALALLLPTPLTRHVVRPSAAEFVQTTRLASLPDEPPALLRQPGVCEVRRPVTERLLGDVVAMGWYMLDGKLHIVTLAYPDNAIAFGIVPAWGTPAVDMQWSTWLGTCPREQCMAVTNWLLTFACLLDAERQPLTVQDEDKPARGKRARHQRKGEWITRRYVYLDRNPPRRDGEGLEVTSPDALADRHELLLEPAHVRGHLRRQPCGPGGKDRKWLYIHDHESHRYRTPAGREIVASTHKKSR